MTYFGLLSQLFCCCHCGCNSYGKVQSFLLSSCC